MAQTVGRKSQVWSHDTQTRVPATTGATCLFIRHFFHESLLLLPLQLFVDLKDGCAEFTRTRTGHDRVFVFAASDRIQMIHGPDLHSIPLLHERLLWQHLVERKNWVTDAGDESET